MKIYLKKPVALASALSAAVCRLWGMVSLAVCDREPHHQPPRRPHHRQVGTGCPGWRGLILVLLLSISTTAHAGMFCTDSPFNGVVDGSIDYTTTIPSISSFPTQITVDTDCTFQNFTADNPLTVTINFQTNDPSIYLIIFDNVVFTGNMACSNIEHKIWFSNGSDYGSNNSCQDLFIPVETISKQVPAGKTTVGIGETFTYTLTLPSMQFPVGDPSPNDLYTVILGDDLTATGADLTYVGINAYYKGTLAPVTLVPEDGSSADQKCGVWSPKNLCYKPIPLISAGEQIVVEITVSVDDAVANTPGTVFVNTAKWWFGREIDINGDGVITPQELFTPLPGEWGVSPPLTIAEPSLVVSKTSPDTALNLGIPANFTIDVRNNGGSGAWNAAIVDRLPDGPTAGMCDYDPTSGPGVTAQIFAADGVTPVTGPLLQGVDYTVSYSGAPTCELTLNMLTAGAVIGPSERLIITYQSQLDADTTADGAALTNVAGATQWYSADGAYPRQSFSNVLTDGSQAVNDFQDAYTITTGLSGYYFQKTVRNLTSGQNPATTAAPADTLSYRLRIFNVDQTIDNITITDTLDPTWFDTSTFSIVTLPVGSTFSFDSVSGVLQVFGNGTPLNVSAGNELLVDFNIKLRSPMANGIVVSNQATFAANGPLLASSDDPYVNGIAAPGDPADATDIVIQAPGPLSKTATQATATIGDRFTYTISVPATPVDVPLYDVRIVDDLSTAAADISFVNAAVVSGGSWTISNTGTATSVVIEDTVTGIDIPANGQAVIEITVELQNTSVNQSGLNFSNSAAFTYNRSDGATATQTSGQAGVSAAMSVVEPGITSITKTADNTAPVAGETVRYTVTLTAGSGAGYSDVFDVMISDSLDIGLVYAGNPSVSVGTGVGADNSIGAPDISGDGIATPQTLLWSLTSNSVTDIDISAGDTITIAYDVQVLNDVLANQTLNNSVEVGWNSNDGVTSAERDGRDGIGGLNDYVSTPVVASVTTPDSIATIVKTRTNDTFGSTDDDVRVGDIVEYTLTLSLSEGTFGNMQLVDTLPQGLDFVEIVSINGNTGPAPYTAVAPFVHADIASSSVTETGDPMLGATTVTWDVGTVTNTPNDGLSDDFVIIYRARVPDSVFAHGSLNVPLNNTVDVNYDTATGNVQIQDPTTTITVRQPELTVSKTAQPSGGDIFIDANEIVRYTIDVTNNGTAPAYDLLLQDTIPVGLRKGTASVTMVSTTLAGIVVADVTPVYDSGTGVVDWNFDTGIADAYTIQPGQTLSVVYDVQADSVISRGQVLSNSVQGVSYSSFDDEAVPTMGSVAGVAELYGPTNTAVTSLFTSSPPTKTLVSPSSAEATIGEEPAYRVTVPGTLSSSTLYDLHITDVLDGNLELLGATVSGGIGITDNSTATTLDITVSEIPANTQVVIDLNTRLRNVQAAQQSVTVNNTVAYDYTYSPGGTTVPTLVSTGAVTFNIVEPDIAAIVKSVDNPTPSAGEIIRYSIDLTAAAGIDATDVFDIAITDTLDPGLVYTGNPTVTLSSGVGSDNFIGAPVVSGDGITVPQTLLWSLANANADIDISEGSVVTVSYDVRVLDSVLAGEVLANSVEARWTGLDGVSAFERDGSDGTGLLNDYITTAPPVAVTTPAINATLVKTRSNDTFGSSDNSVRIGDIVEYTLTMSLAEGTAGNVQLVDTLPQGLDFAGIVSINGDTGPAPFTAVAPFVHDDILATDVTTAGDPTVGPTTVTWNIGNVTNQPVDNMSNDFVIIYRARVLDNVHPQLNTINLNNSVTLSYAAAAGTVTYTTGAGVTLLQPALVISKSAAPAGGDTVIAAGELVTYTVDITNNGTAPAYDPVVQDIIPDGMRYGTATITVVNTMLGGVAVSDVIPVYDPASGVAVWDFDTGVADAYTIQPGQTLSIVYQVQAEDTLGTDLSLSNQAQVQTYSSFDNNAVPSLGTVSGTAEVYGPSNTAVVTLTSPVPASPAKQNTVSSAAVGDQFSYRIIVPATPQPAALYDVRILDDLSSTAADLSFVSVNRISGTMPWTPVNTGTATNLVIEDTSNGIDIPAGTQVEIEITVLLNDTATNVSGLLFNNSATYTFDRYDNDATPQNSNLTATTADMVIVGPDTLTLEKSGPATMRAGLPGTFTLDIHNAGTATAYDATIIDVIPDPVPGGMCNTAPAGIGAQLYQADGVTPVGAALVQNVDFSTSFTKGTSDCTLVFTMKTPAAAIPPDNHLIINYDLELDLDSLNNVSLTNKSAVTEWFSGDTSGTGASGQIRTYTRTLTDGSVATLDHEDAHTVITDSPIIQFQKYVINTTTGQDPGSNAVPGDTLRYRIVATNVSMVNVPNFSIIDDLDQLNGIPAFVPGSLTLVSVPVGADVSATDPYGGVNGTGQVDVRNLSLGVAGGGNDTVSVEFEVILAPVIDSGTVVLNQSFLQVLNLPPQPSDDPVVNGVDDPNVIGDEDPTQTLIDSAPLFQVDKISDDLSGSTNVLLPGDTLRYTISVKNIGDENAVNTVLQDTIPANTTYIASTTTLNGNAVADPTPGISAVEGGLVINAVEDSTAGFMRADATVTSTNVATITFDVQVDSAVINGTVIANQATVDAEGAGVSGPVAQQLSDDPATATVNDPTRDIVGSLPLVDAQKTVALSIDNGTSGVVDPGDVLRYTITIGNYGAVEATGVTLVDAVPSNTTYVADSVVLNGQSVGQPDGGVSPLAAGIAVNSSDQIPPVPGTLSAGGEAVITFDVQVDAATPSGTIISNQGVVSSNELPAESTDADGLDANGDQPTLITVGNAQQLMVTKDVSVVGGGPVLGGVQLEYVVRVTNIGTVDATDVVIEDNLDPAQMTYVSGSALLNGLPAGISDSSLPMLTADYGNTYGALQPGQFAEFRFRVVLDPGLVIGQTVTNTAQSYWNAMTQTASASVSIDIGAMPGVANLNGRVWHDSNFDDMTDSGETRLENWAVEVYFRGNLLGTVFTDVNGEYHIDGLMPSYLGSDRYELRFVAPGAGSNSASLGEASSVFTNTLQSITDIIVYPGTTLQDLNLPLDPDGVIYDSVVRVPVAGATVTMLQASSGTVLPAACFDDPAQQGQVTLINGFYKFDLNFSQPECISGDSYVLRVTPPATGYNAGESFIIPAQTNASTAPISVPGCLGTAADAVAATPDHCEVQTSATEPPLSSVAGSAATDYHLHLLLANGQIPGESQLFNNHIPVDPVLDQAVTISKTTPLMNVSRGELVPYTIVINNTLPVPLTNITVFDTIPAGFKYIDGSARLNGVATDPVVNGLQLSWSIPDIAVNDSDRIELVLVAGAGVSEGEYANRARVYSSMTSAYVSEEAAATVRVVPDPAFDCTDIIGKVFDDRNMDGYQDDDEPGLSGVRLATARGLLVTSDEYGRFHVTCAASPDEQRGSNLILKLDERSLPSGYRVTTENPRVQHATRGKMVRFNFGATVHHVVTLSVAEGAFEKNAARIRPQWLPRLDVLISELRKKPSVLRLTYLADVETEALVDDRVEVLRREIQKRWRQNSTNDLAVENEVFWRHGRPVSKSAGMDVSNFTPGKANPAGFGEDSEMQLPFGYAYSQWLQDDSAYRVDDGPRFETRQVTEKKFTTMKLEGLVPPILFKSGKADIPDEVVAKLREILDGMNDRANVRLHFIGHTDNVRLRGALKHKYEDNMGLSKERAGTTAEFFQRALGLPPEAISYEGMGDTMPVASNRTAVGRARNRRVEVQVWYDEISEEQVERKVEIDRDIKRVMVCHVETMCKLRYKEGHSRRTRLKNLIPPFHYDEGVSEIPAQYLRQLKQVLHNLSNKNNVKIRFIGYTDNTPLAERNARIYGDHVGLSKANARRVAILMQEALGLDSMAIESTGRGSVNPLASNNSEKGRALNRRIEVEFWHDDPLEDLPDEPQICPEDAAAETVERVYNPPEGDFSPIHFENGQPQIAENLIGRLQRAMTDVSDKGNVRLRFIGYTGNKRLDRRTAMVYGDDIGLSTARARRTMEAVKAQMGLSDAQVEYEGRGYVQSLDVANTGFIELERSKVEVQVVYDELALLDDMEGVMIKRITRNVEIRNPFALNMMRISVDGQPLNDPHKNIPDVQRCTDVALDRARVQFSFDNMQVKPRLNVTAWPDVVAFNDLADTDLVENSVHFRSYSNFPAFINRAEVRLFRADQSTRDTPVAIVALDEHGEAQWQVAIDEYTTPRTLLKYVLRVYDKQDNFSETGEQTLWIVDRPETDSDAGDIDRHLLAGYGENRLALDNIPLNGGVVRIHGQDVPKNHQVWFAGRPLPVTDNGEFAGEYILPSGLHTVEVAIVDEAGNGDVYQRDLALEKGDWFYVGMADLNVSRDRTNGPAQLVTGDQNHFNNDLSLDGRLAFYIKGKLANESVFTASADTREGPIEELFTNFMDKYPESLFRRIDPDYFYPTYGDDSQVEEDAPTDGKFYIRWQKDNNYGLWGNFDIAYMDSRLAQVDRVLYGFNTNYESDSATNFGEKHYSVNLFAAESGTQAGRDELLGTGGSLYYLRHQDILTGSERLRIEMRDAVSGLVVGVKNLVHGLDYDIDYIQGRIMLSRPLSASASSGMLVDSADLGGNDVYLVARYEYTPGFATLDDVMTGGQGYYWLTDRIRLGITAEDSRKTGERNALGALNLTFRKSAGTWLKLEQSSSQGAVSSSLLSADGGYAFNELALAPGTDLKAKGQRIDFSIRFEDVFDNFNGTLTFFNQQLDAGYAAPGLIALTDTSQSSLLLQIPVNELFSIRFKVDAMSQQDALETEAMEVDIDYQINENWKTGLGYRNDQRRDHSASVMLTQQQGDRNDLVINAAYDSHADWTAYGFVQGTTVVSGNRDENGRVGAGGSYRFSDRLMLDGELSGGDLGEAADLGVDYKLTDSTGLYSSYALENERSDNGVKARKGNMTTGFKSHFSDSASIYVEEQYTHGDVPTGLTHALGIDLNVNEHMNLGVDIDIGSLRDNITGAETGRTAMGIHYGYKFASLAYAGALEYRNDRTEQADTSVAERNAWLTKNSVKYQLNPDWRLIGKLNLSSSESSLGDLYDGEFVEAVLGYALRPVDNDALNALVKYTYFYNLPAADQVTGVNTAANYIQKSHILSADILYDVTKQWTLGGKYAYRDGLLALDRVNPQFFDSNASLYILKAEWHFTRRWDALMEGRILDVAAAGDRRDGLLLGIYRQLGDHLKLGTGYNFTDFSDDLTDMDYNSQGLFINAVGKF